MFYSNKIKKGRKIPAKYSPSKDPMFRHNAFAEALPDLDIETVISRVKREPFYDSKERSLEDIYRINAVQRISSFVEPLELTIDAYLSFSRVIKYGYLNRNPNSIEWTKQMNSAFPTLDLDAGDDYYIPTIHSNAASFGIFGTSGMGKTTIINSVLDLYPQEIIHTEYNGHSFVWKQIVWLKLECPPDGSINSLGRSFFDAIDQVLDTNYFKKFFKLAAKDMVIKMAELAYTYGIGVIVIDEVQWLRDCKKEDANRMLNFFVYLINAIGVPIVLVGTFRVLKLVLKQFAQARRLEGQGDFLINMYDKNDDNWKHFMEKLWKYQWTKVPVKLSPKIEEAMYNETLGIPDIAVKLYKLVQWTLIGEEDETITPAVIKKVASEELKLIKTYFDILKSKSPNKLSNLPEDFIISNNDIEKYCLSSKQKILVKGALNNYRLEEKIAQKNEDVDDSPVMVVTQRLILLGIEADTAYNHAQKVVSLYPNLDLKSITKKAYIEISEEEERTKVQSNRAQKRKSKKTKKAKSNSNMSSETSTDDLEEFLCDTTEFYELAE